MVVRWLVVVMTNGFTTKSTLTTQVRLILGSDTHEVTYPFPEAASPDDPRIICLMQKRGTSRMVLLYPKSFHRDEDHVPSRTYRH